VSNFNATPAVQDLPRTLTARPISTSSVTGGLVKDFRALTARITLDSVGKDSHQEFSTKRRYFRNSNRRRSTTNEDEILQ
jgi:hypothetical protein